MVPYSVYKSRLVIQGVRFLRRNAINDSRFEDLTSKIWLRAGRLSREEDTLGRKRLQSWSVSKGERRSKKEKEKRRRIVFRRFIRSRIQQFAKDTE